jgi:hypothetical protein
MGRTHLAYKRAASRELLNGRSKRALIVGEGVTSYWNDGLNRFWAKWNVITLLMLLFVAFVAYKIYGIISKSEQVMREENEDKDVLSEASSTEDTEETDDEEDRSISSKDELDILVENTPEAKNDDGSAQQGSMEDVDELADEGDKDDGEQVMHVANEEIGEEKQQERNSEASKSDMDDKESETLSVQEVEHEVVDPVYKTPVSKNEQSRMDSASPPTRHNSAVHSAGHRSPFLHNSTDEDQVKDDLNSMRTTQNRIKPYLSASTGLFKSQTTPNRTKQSSASVIDLTIEIDESQ